MFIADASIATMYTGPDRVREVDLATGIITTVAGNGVSGYRRLARQSLQRVREPARYLLIADLDGNCIRQVDLTTGIIATVAATGTAGFSGDAALNHTQLAGFVGDCAWEVVANARGDVFEGAYRGKYYTDSLAPVALDLPGLPIDGTGDQRAVHGRRPVVPGQAAAAGRPGHRAVGHAGRGDGGHGTVRRPRLAARRGRVRRPGSARRTPPASPRWRRTPWPRRTTSG